MSRATRYLMMIAAVTVVAVVGVFFYLSRYPGSYDAVLVVALLFFVPGRISSAFLKDLYRCRRHVDREEYEAAIECGERFLATLRKQPWRARLIYLTWSLYTWNVEAMTRNNIGAAEMMRGRFAAAREQFNAALALDSGYALPYANLAIMAAVEGDHTESERLMALARRNGYAEKAVDRLVARVGAAYAGVQGRPLNP